MRVKQNESLRKQEHGWYRDYSSQSGENPDWEFFRNNVSFKNLYGGD